MILRATRVEDGRDAKRTAKLSKQLLRNKVRQRDLKSAQSQPAQTMGQIHTGLFANTIFSAVLGMPARRLC